jgi:hypothetical protein
MLQGHSGFICDLDASQSVISFRFPYKVRNKVKLADGRVCQKERRSGDTVTTAWK